MCVYHGSWASAVCVYHGSGASCSHARGVESKAWTVVRRVSTNVHLIIHCAQTMNGVTLGLQEGILLILEVRKDPRKRDSRGAGFTGDTVGEVFLHQGRGISRPIMKLLKGKSLEKASVETKGRKSREGPSPAGNWDRLREFEVYSEIHWLCEMISCLVLKGLC